MANKQTDPICGMELDATEAVVQFQHKGKVFYFCSLECNKKFCDLVDETSKALQDADAQAKETESDESR